MSVSGNKLTAADLVDRERKRQGLIRGKTLYTLYSERDKYLDESYDPYTSYIDNYADEKKAEAKNKSIRAEQQDMKQMIEDLFFAESDRYLAMYKTVHHCDENHARKSLSRFTDNLDKTPFNQHLDEIMFNNYNMYKTLAANPVNQAFLKEIGCDVYDELDRANGMFDTKHEGILPASKLYQEDPARQHFVLEKYDETIRGLVSRFGYNGHSAYRLDKFREVSDIMRSENRTVPTENEIRDLTVDEYGSVCYMPEEFEFLKEYDSNLFDKAVIQTNSYFKGISGRGSEFDSEFGSSGDETGFSL